MVVRNGMVSLESAWRREERIGSRGQVFAWLDCSEERGIKCVRGRKDGGGGKGGADVLHLLGKVGYKVISCEGGRKERGRGEEGREHGKKPPGVGVREVFV